MSWKTLLAYITGTVKQELLVRNEYWAMENQILHSQIKGRMQLSDGERKALAVIGQKLGKQALQEVAKIVKPDTIVGWHRKFVAQKFDGSKQRKTPGRPTIDQEVETLVVAHGAGESLLGLRPHRGSSGQPGLYGQRPDHGQHPQVSWHCASARAQDHRHVERISPYAQGHQGRHKTMPCCTLPLVERGECIIGWLMDGEWMRAHRVENV
jgi:hypothetical protein